MSQPPSTGIPLTTYPSVRSNHSQRNAANQSLPEITAQRSSFTVQSHNSTPEDEKELKPYKPGGKRRVHKTDSKRFQEGENGDGGVVRLNAMGRLYQKLFDYSWVTRYALYILPLGLIFMVLIIVGATVASDAKIGGVRMVWFFTWFEALWLTLFGMKAVAKALPMVFTFFAGVVSNETKKYGRILANLEKSIILFGWVVINYVLFAVLFSTASAGNTPLGWVSTVKKVFGAVLTSVVILLIEKVAIQLIAVSYHARSYNNKIEESKHNVYLLGLLFEASRTLFPMYCDDFLEEDYVIHSNIESFLKKENKGSKIPKSLLHGPGRALVGVGKIGNTVNTLFGNVAGEFTGKKMISPNSSQAIVTEALQKTRSAKALAQRLWFSFVVEGKDALYLDDLKEVLGPEASESAEEAFVMLDIDGNGDVSLDEMIMRVAEISTTRKAIGKSMRDVSQAIKALDRTLTSVVALVAVFVLVCFVDTGFSSILSTASSTLISLSFIFSTTAAEFFGSCIFLFVKHPYDIDDRIDIWGPDGTMNRLVVQTISLFYTDFKRIDNMEWVQVPNNILNTLWINNITRSKAMIEKIDINISFDTPLEDIEALRAEIENFVQAPENKRDFQPDVILQCNAVGGMDKLQLTLHVRHKSNWSVENVRVTRHSKLMCALVLALRKVPIFAPGGGGLSLGDPGNPSYSVAISDEMAAQAREKAAKDADTARLHPMKTAAPAEENPEDEDAIAPKSEIAAAEKLNARKPGEDPIRQEDDDDVEIGGGPQGLSVSKLRSGGSGSLATGMGTGLDLNRSASGNAVGRRRAGCGASMSVSSRQTDGVAQRPETGDTLSVPPRVASSVLGAAYDEEAEVGQ